MREKPEGQDRAGLTPDPQGSRAPVSAGKGVGRLEALPACLQSLLRPAGPGRHSPGPWPFPAVGARTLLAQDKPRPLHSGGLPQPAARGRVTEAEGRLLPHAHRLPFHPTPNPQPRLGDAALQRWAGASGPSCGGKCVGKKQGYWWAEAALPRSSDSARGLEAGAAIPRGRVPPAPESSPIQSGPPDTHALPPSQGAGWLLMCMEITC